MMLKETLKDIILSQKKDLTRQETGIKRELLQHIDFSLPHALVISGIRRCGKSTLLHQLMAKVKNPNYFNFEDPRALQFQVSDFDKLVTAFEEMNGKSDILFFDEIQNVPQWEHAVRKLLDASKKCIITGSNASLLSKELGTRLTGRHMTYELFPFSYSEFLAFTKQKPSKSSFEQYLASGGFPEYLKFQRDEILQELFIDIIARDIAVRHKIRESRTLRELASYLLTNIGKEFSYNKLAKIFHMGSPNTAIAYLSFFEDSYMLFSTPKFSFSLQKQRVNQKKIYAIDCGLLRANAVSFSSDKGRILENTVFTHLRKKYKEIYYFKERGECDFIVRQRSDVQAIQVCYDLTEENKQRELDGLQEAMKALKIKKGLLLTFDQEDTIDNIKIMPVWKWLIS